MSASFPLLTLQPVSDMRHAWVALLLDAAPAADAAQLARIFGEFGLAEALGPLSCIVGLADAATDVSALPAEKTVLSLPAAACCDRANDATFAALRAAGFRLMGCGLPQADQVPFAGVDAFALPCPGHGIAAGVFDWLEQRPGPHLAVGADEITCPGRCHFQWLVGNVPAEAHHAARSGEAPHGTLLIELLAKVANDADSHEIESVIKRDPQLSYHLLKLVNSVSFSLTKKIESFGQAITLLGRRQLQRWLQLLLYARSSGDDEANPLLPRAAMRAGVVEALCAARGGSREAQDRAFMAGMFSLLDALFGKPLAEIVKPLNLADDVVNALIDRSGPLGMLLRAAEAGERAPGPELAAILGEAGIAAEDWARAAIHASQWAIQVSREA